MKMTKTILIPQVFVAFAFYCFLCCCVFVLFCLGGGGGAGFFFFSDYLTNMIFLFR